MPVVIVKKLLTKNEKSKVIESTKSYENIVYIGSRTWDSFDRVYKIYSDKDFTGVCAVNTFGDYAKFGPLVLLPEFHGSGLGKKLITNLFKIEKKNFRLYVGSSNPIVWKIIKGLDFKEIKSKALPFSVTLIYLKMSLKVLFAGEFIPFLKELMRKLKTFPKRNKLRHFCLDEISI